MKIVPYLTKYKWFIIAGFIISIIACCIYLSTLKPYYVATAYAMPKKLPALEVMRAVDGKGISIKEMGGGHQGLGVFLITHTAKTKQQAKDGLVLWINKYNKWQPNTVKVERYIQEIKVMPDYKKIIVTWGFMSVFILFGLVLAWVNRRMLFWEDENENCSHCGKSIHV